MAQVVVSWPEFFCLFFCHGEGSKTILLHITGMIPVARMFLVSVDWLADTTRKWRRDSSEAKTEEQQQQHWR